MKAINKKFYFICVGFLSFLFVSFIFGSFFDLKISQTIYDQSSLFGMFFASFGEMPAWFALAIGGTIIFKISYKENIIWKKIVGCIFALLAIGVSTYMIFKCQNSRWNGLNQYLSWCFELIIAIILEVLFVLFGWFFVNIDDKSLLLKIAICCIAIVAFEALVINILKLLWSRPRFRLIVDGGTLEGSYYSVEQLFRSWFQPGSGIAKDIFIDVPADQFKSFPSGHTSDSTVGLIFFFFPLLNKKTEKNKYLPYIIVSISIIWIICVASSRINYGAHYLSDVTFGGLVCTSILFILIFVVFRDKTSKEKNA